jgi:hypothetical protein
VAGAVIGTTLGNVILSRRQRRLASEATRYSGPGENLAAPIPYCHQGGRRVQATGVTIFVLAIVVGLVCAATTHNGGLTGAVFFGGMCTGLLVIWAAVILAKNYAIVWTDRRLLLFRMKGRIRQRLREVEVAVPRGQVSMSARMRIDGPAVSLPDADSLITPR